MSREVCFLISRSGALLSFDASESPAALADSRDRWQAIWAHRAELECIAHSHPFGPRQFSAEDLSTMQAIDAALGRPLRYVVVAPDGLYVRDGGADFRSNECPWWVELLRLASGMGPKE